jgi:histidine ammonia-lyase
MLDHQTSSVLSIGDDELSCKTLAFAAWQQTNVALSHTGMNKIMAARQVVENLLQNNITAYGITTGVGSQKNHAVDNDIVKMYNRQLIRGHGTRVPGDTWAPEIVRGALIVMLNSFSAGKSGVTPELVAIILAKIAADELPDIDVNGSVGASDLVPLAQTAEWILNSPEAQAAGLPHAKEALSLMNNNAYSLSAGACYISELHDLMNVYSLVAAVTIEGFQCNPDAISTEVNAAHRRRGQTTIAAQLRDHLAGSHLWQPDAPRLLQDPLSFRNISQIHGAGLDVLEWLTGVWNDELNSVNDNPIVSVDSNRAFSHGNMDTTRQTLALDAMRQALAKIVDVSCERIHKLQWPAFTGLPIGLAADDSPIGGVQFLNLGHIAASLGTGVKMQATPHVLFSVGQVADGVEDTSGNAIHAVQSLKRIIDDSWKVIAVEIAVAVWAIDRRGIALADLGRDVRDVFKLIRPLLPIGTEGEEIFDLGVVVSAIKVHLIQTTRLSCASNDQTASFSNTEILS